MKWFFSTMKENWTYSVEFFFSIFNIIKYYFASYKFTNSSKKYSREGYAWGVRNKVFLVKKNSAILLDFFLFPNSSLQIFFSRSSFGNVFVLAWVTFVAFDCIQFANSCQPEFVSYANRKFFFSMVSLEYSHCIQCFSL